MIRVKNIETRPNFSHVDAQFDLTVEVTRPLGGPKKTVNVPVACRDSAFVLSPNSVAVTIQQDAKSGTVTKKASISGTVDVPLIDLILEATLDTVKTCVHSLQP